ncbi:hypothetical protein D2E16_12410 [Streptococcus suis]|nr:hypothetical protein D2E16_12410 [Streptococcus suis]
MIVRLLGLFLSLECLFTIYRLFSMTLLSLVIVRIWFIICDVKRQGGLKMFGFMGFFVSFFGDWWKGR